MEEGHGLILLGIGILIGIGFATFIVIALKQATYVPTVAAGYVQLPDSLRRQ